MLCGACNIAKSNNLTMSGLWRALGVRGKERQRVQGLLKETQDKARAKVREMDAGAAVQQAL